MNTLEQHTYETVKLAAHKIVKELDQPNWERRRFIAAALILSFCATDAMSEAAMTDSDDIEGYLEMSDIKLHCRVAIDYADELIKQLKDEG